MKKNSLLRRLKAVSLSKHFRALAIFGAGAAGGAIAMSLFFVCSSTSLPQLNQRFLSALNALSADRAKSGPLPLQGTFKPPVVRAAPTASEAASSNALAVATSTQAAEASQTRLQNTASAITNSMQSNDSPNSGSQSALPAIEVIEPEAAFTINRDAILSDYQNRVNSDFKVSKGLHDRVAFWFDIYARFDSNHRVVHHAAYPWIVFKVIDVTSIVEASVPATRWLRNAKADAFVDQQTHSVRQALVKLAARGEAGYDSFDDLTADERNVALALRPLGGKLNEVAAEALLQVRVQTGQRDHFVNGLATSSRYLPYMEQIFRSNGLPIELTRLPFVESSFNDQATSRVGASGIWQFMNSTGRKYLVVQNEIDERRSPLKSTEAAAVLLKENHFILFRSWPLAVTAWNHGPNGVRQAMRETHSHDIATIIANYHSKSFDFASANFYSEFLAALYAERYRDEIYADHEAKRTLVTERMAQVRLVQLSRSVKFLEIARASGLDSATLLEFNPELRQLAQKNGVLPRGFRLEIPSTKMTALRRGFAVAVRDSDSASVN